VVAHVLNDESFAIAVARRNPPDPWVYIGSAAAICGAFLGGVAVGTQVGGLVADPARWGLDFAFPAVFLALVAVQLRRRADWLVALTSAVTAVAIALVLPGNWHIVVTGVAVSGVAALWLTPEAA
jgi:predicted branched-subunit amino acid permease